MGVLLHFWNDITISVGRRRKDTDPPPCARGPWAFAPTAGQGLWVLVFAGACQGTAWAGLCLIHHNHGELAKPRLRASS